MKYKLIYLIQQLLMNHTTSLLFTITILFSCINIINSQRPTCYSQTFRSQYISKDQYKAHINKRNLSVDLRDNTTIPIVFHIVYSNEEENISKQQILSQIDELNRAFGNDNADRLPDIFKSIAGQSDIRFCLAKVNPTGEHSEGITRTMTNKLNVGSPKNQDIKFTLKGGHDAWDSKKYLNVWVGNVGDNLLGYSSFPDIAGSNIDGIVIDPRYFGTIPTNILTSPYIYGRTLVHEMGHYLGLCHLSGCQSNSCEVDDNIEDTPIQSANYALVDCPTHPQISCQSEDMFMNFMSLASDPCLVAFTQNQVDRMRFELNDKRPGLLSSNSCNHEPIVQWEKNIIVKRTQHDHGLLIETTIPFKQPIELAIYDVMGRLIHTSSFQEKYLVLIDQSFSQGVYILYFYDSENTFSKKTFLY